jgi:hypothetical protein
MCLYGLFQIIAHIYSDTGNVEAEISVQHNYKTAVSEEAAEPIISIGG